MTKLEELRVGWLSAYAAANVATIAFVDSATCDAARDNTYNSACDAIDIADAAYDAYKKELENDKT